MNPISEIIHIGQLKETIEAQSTIIEYYKKKCKKLTKIISSEFENIAQGKTSPQGWFYFALPYRGNEIHIKRRDVGDLKLVTELRFW